MLFLGTHRSMHESFSTYSSFGRLQKDDIFCSVRVPFLGRAYEYAESLVVDDIFHSWLFYSNVSKARATIRACFDHDQPSQNFLPTMYTFCSFHHHRQPNSLHQLGRICERSVNSRLLIASQDRLDQQVKWWLRGVPIEVSLRTPLFKI